VEGLLLRMSALAHQPMQQVWLQNMPAVGGCTAGYLTQVGSQTGDVLALMLVAQLMPAPPTPPEEQLSAAATLNASGGSPAGGAAAGQAGPPRGPPARRRTTGVGLSEVGGTGRATRAADLVQAASSSGAARPGSGAAGAGEGEEGADGAPAGPQRLTSSATRAVVQL
jgi:hypothetical protein